MTAEVCPYCRTKISADDRPMVCEGCGTAHHADCYAENGGCTIFGCSKAPGDEPKVSVSTPELGTVAAAAPAGGVENRLPPPPPPGVVIPPATTQDLRHVANRVVPSMFGGFAGEDPAGPAEEAVVHEPKNRTSFIMLGALLGAFGAHNFYAGYYKKAGIQLAITLLTVGFGSPMSWMWAVIDICTIDRDRWGVQFES
jgi:TM2 domain-containing membrane protein YozV